MVPSEEPLDDLEEILFEVLCAIDDGADVEELLVKHPNHADGLRRRLAHLGHLQMDGSMEWTPPQWLGRYRLESVLGKGGMGEVWRAVEKDTDRVVALKFVRGAAIAPSHARRFEREAEALARLDHPGIVGIHDAGEADGFRYIAMDLLEGRSLDRILQDGPSPEVRTVVAWGLDLALALASAHGEGVVHRDVKPSNIQITPDGRAVLIDFGLTRGLGPSSLSMTGRFVGSPHYAPPEQIHGNHEDVGPAADIYALGVTLYEALCGRLPFDGTSSEQLFHRILTRDPLPIRRQVPAVKADLEAVILTALEKRPEDRYSTSAEFAADLSAVMELQPVSVKGPSTMRRLRGWARRRPAPAAVLAMALLAAIALPSVDMITDYRQGLENRREARAELGQATILFEQFVRETDDLPHKIDVLAWREPEIATKAFARGDVLELDDLLREIEESESFRESAFTSVMEHLRRAEELDPALPGVGRMRARMYLERWRIAKREGARVMQEFFAARVRQHDEDGDLAAEVDPTRKISITVDPPGARVDAFLFQRHDSLVSGGEPRSVPIPMGGLPGGMEPGLEVLKVKAASPPLQAEDLILRVAGQPVSGSVFLDRGDGEQPARVTRMQGEPVFNIGEAEDHIASYGSTVSLSWGFAGQEQHGHWSDFQEPRFLSPLAMVQLGGVPIEVWRNGRVLELVSPEDVSLRPTAAPLWHGDRSLVGIAPISEQEVSGDKVLLLIRAEGHVPMRYTLLDYEQDIHVALDPVDRYPEPFVRIHNPNGSLVVMDREITTAEYLRFIQANPTRPLPLGWSREEGGAILRPSHITLDFPAYGMTWNDAIAYASWCTAEAKTAGLSHEFVLPDHRHWLAVINADGFSPKYIWGFHYRSHYTKSCFARDQPRPEPVLRFSIDETVHGLHDTAGGVSEFCRGWFWEERGQRPVAGGAWVNGDASRFETKFFWGAGVDRAFEYVGFRLAIVEDQTP